MFVLSVHVLQGLAILFMSFGVNGYPNGAPASTCWTRYPKHKNLGTQTSPCPIQITFSSPTYSPGAEIKITVGDPNPTKKSFVGIQMAAFRDSDNQEEIVGQFVKIPEKKLKTMTCFGGYQNMITHMTNEKVQTLEITWKAPDENVGNLTFRATIVENFEIFWTQEEANLPSAIQDSATIKPPKYQGIIPQLIVKDVDFSSCGDSKGCFLYPKQCSGDNCLAAVSFQHRPNTDDYLFELSSATKQNWISLGFSDDTVMTFDETVSCVVKDSGIITVQHGWNPGYHNERMITRYLSDVEVKYSDGQLQCRFVLPRISSVYIINQATSALDYRNITFDREQDQFLMLAWGNAMAASDVISKHVEMPAVTFEKVNMKDTSTYRGSAFPMLVRVHGALMIIAWIFFGGIVTVVARHYRDWLPRQRLLGTKIWFQVHRELAVLIFVLTVIGIIVIFAYYGSSIRKQAVPHAYVGLTVLTAVGVQVIAGILRPQPDHKFRIWFNWGHRFLGQSAHILAAVTMFLAFDIKYFNSDMKTFGTAVLSVWVAVQLMWHIAFEVLTFKGMPLFSSKESTDSSKDSGVLDLHSILLASYVIVLAGLCIAALLAFLLF